MFRSCLDNGCGILYNPFRVKSMKNVIFKEW